ncbi:MAG: hypothetical protein J6T01_04890 [Kiritimatiellae bacterium]|nr:hypothetical protein [Kiritimatiellia bacterium]
MKRKLRLDYPLHSDCGDVAKFNGKGRDNPYYKIMGRYRLRWFDVRWEPGELRAVRYLRGRKIGVASVKTAAKADAAGTRVPDAGDRVGFAVRGDAVIEAVGNGDPRDYDSVKDVAGNRLFHGKALVILRRTGKGPATLTASAPGLATGKINIKHL